VIAVPRTRRFFGKSVGERRGGPLTYAVLALVTVLAILPLYWTVVAASRTNADISKTPPPLTPGGNLFSNIREALDQVDMFKALLNSLVVSGAIALGTVFFCTLAGFAFAKLRFRGRNALMLAVVATMMVPTQLGVIPLYILMNKLHWTNTLQAVIAPMMVTAFGVFFMRQYIAEAVPTELLEAGRVDGCSTFRLFWHIVAPAARPGAAVLGMLTFMQAWTDFFWPLIVLTPDNPTVQVAISTLASGYHQDYTLVLAGTTLGVLPLFVVFALLGKQIIGGIMQGAVKG
jgi:cellobiose transport system permease protein